jgi:4-amino-4-deoxy-L-arabinose transferase-like glycosyltransferase
VVARGIEPEHDLGGRFPGIWEASDDATEVTSQFYHLYSATLATAEDLGGRSALFNLSPVLAALAVAVLAIGARRAFGTLVALLMAAFLITSAMQVWQAKYPSTEIMAQLFLAGALLGAVLTVAQRWAGGALASGLLIGTGFLVRPDGFLYLLFGVIVLAAAIIARPIHPRVDRRPAAFVGGLALTLPYAFYNAYVVRDEYSRINDVPGPLLLTGVIALIIGAGVAGRRLLARAEPASPNRMDLLEQGVARWQRPVGLVAALALGLIMLLLYHRETLFGQTVTVGRFSGGEVVRSYAEMNMVWLSWFFSRAGLVIVWLGICVLALQKWQAPRLLFVLPGLALLPVYAYDARVSMRLMWWVRRFVPAILPVLVLLLALAIAWALTRRSWGLRAVGATALVVMLLRFADLSLPLRDHREMEGSWELAEAIAAQTPDERGVYLYPQPRRGLYDPIAITPGAVWWIFDQIAARLPADYDLSTIEEYQDAFPDHPVLLVSDGDDLPPRLPADRFERTGVIVDDLVVLEETQDRRPEESRTFPWQVSVWRLTEPAA